MLPRPYLEQYTGVYPSPGFLSRLLTRVTTGTVLRPPLSSFREEILIVNKNTTDK